MTPEQAKRVFQALSGMVEWFDDNFAGESYLNDDEDWIPYTDHPTYVEACEALEAVTHVDFASLKNFLSDAAANAKALSEPIEVTQKKD